MNIITLYAITIAYCYVFVRKISEKVKMLRQLSLLLEEIDFYFFFLKYAKIHIMVGG